MTLTPPCSASTNPGLPGFARFWGPRFSQTRLSGTSAADAARAQLVAKTFLQESIPASPIGSRLANGADCRRERNFPTGKFFGRLHLNAFNRPLLRTPSIRSTGWRSWRVGVSASVNKEGP
jgi:hypothetical protein